MHHPLLPAAYVAPLFSASVSLLDVGGSASPSVCEPLPGHCEGTDLLLPDYGKSTKLCDLRQLLCTQILSLLLVNVLHQYSLVLEDIAFHLKIQSVVPMRQKQI